MSEHEYLERIRDLLPRVADRAEEAEALRRIPDDTVKALRDGGLLKALQPSRFGGLELDPLTLYRAERMLGSVCGSTAWVFGVLGVHPWQLALFPERAQAEVWDGDDTALVASTYAPVGRIERVEGGYRLNGQWPWSSGTDHCKWVLLGGVDATDAPDIDMRTYLLPRSDYEIVDTWHAAGLKGTGTNDILVEDAFVPTYRSLSFSDMSVCDCPGNRINDAPIYRLPFASVFSSAIAAASIGIAEGALLAFKDHLSTRFKIAFGEAQRQDPHAQIVLARSHSMVDGAWLRIERNMQELTERARRGEPMDTLSRARVRHDQAYGVGRAVEAVDRCFEASGGGVLRQGDRLQRFWRDVHAARQHAVNDYERAAVMYGKALLGLEVDDPML